MLWSHIVTEMTIIHPTDSLLTLLICKAFLVAGDAMMNVLPQEAYLHYKEVSTHMRCTSCPAGKGESKVMKEAERQKQQRGTRRKKQAR